MRLTYWNCKEKGSALPVGINDDGDTVDLETLCAKLAAYEDTGLMPEEITHLRAEVARLERERDAAVADIKRTPQIWPCFACKHTGKMSDRCHISDRDCFEWRGTEETR